MERITIRGDHGIFLEPRWDFGIDPEDFELVQKILDRLAYYEDLEELGRLLVLPCEVGDTAYWLHDGRITTCRVYRIQVSRNGLYLVLKSTVIHGAFHIDLVGTAVFFDLEEAEKALRGGAG